MKLTELKENIINLKDLCDFLHLYKLRNILYNIINNFNDIEKVISLIKESPKIDYQILIIHNAYINIFKSFLTEFTKIKKFYDDIKEINIILSKIKLSKSSYDPLYDKLLLTEHPIYKKFDNDIKIKIDLTFIIEQIKLLITNFEYNKLKKIKDKLSLKGIDVLNGILNKIIDKKVYQEEVIKIITDLINNKYKKEILWNSKLIEELYFESAYGDFVDDEIFEESIYLFIEEEIPEIREDGNLTEVIRNILGNTDILNEDLDETEIANILKSYDKEILIKLFDYKTPRSSYLEKLIKNISYSTVYILPRNKKELDNFFSILKRNNLESLIKEIKDLIPDYIKELNEILIVQDKETIGKIHKILFHFTVRNEIKLLNLFESKNLELVEIYNEGLYYVLDENTNIKKEINYTKDLKKEEKEFILSKIKYKTETLGLKQDLSDNFELINKQYKNMIIMDQGVDKLLHKLVQLYYIIVNDRKIRDKKIPKTIYEIIIQIMEVYNDDTNYQRRVYIFIIDKFTELNKEVGVDYEIKENEIEEYLNNIYSILDIYEIIKLYKSLLLVKKDNFNLKYSIIEKMKKLLKFEYIERNLIEYLLKELNNAPKNKYEFKEFEDINKYLEEILFKLSSPPKR